MRTVFVRLTKVRGRSCSRFPLIVKDDGAVLMDVMRYLMSCFAQGSSADSLRTYAGHLRDFHEQLTVDGREVSGTTIEYLNGYRAAIERRASPQYAAQVLRTTLSFLVNLEERCGVCGIVGEGPGYEVQITRTKGGGLSHPLIEGGRSPKSNWYPSDRAIGLIKAFGPDDPRLSERFTLMVDWCHVRGLRAKEVCALLVSQLPDSLSIERALEEGRMLEILLKVTKGGKPRNVEVHPVLIARTRKWIDTDRKSLRRVVEKRAREKGWSVPASDALFISESTGEALTPKAFSNSVRTAFLRAVNEGKLTKEERVWLHGLRKRMINREIDARPRTDANRREHEVMGQVGHASLSTLGRYVVDLA